MKEDELATELRTIADRLEDGEYIVDHIEVQRPEMDEHGHFKFEFEHIEDFRRKIVFIHD